MNEEGVEEERDVACVDDNIKSFCYITSICLGLNMLLLLVLEFSMRYK